MTDSLPDLTSWCEAPDPSEDPETAAARMEREIRRLPASSLLLERAPFAVYLARSWSIPNLLLELGRLRAEAFPAAFPAGGIDLDPFDQRYSHLFVWNRAEREIVGGYRLACTDGIDTDEIGAVQGPRQLYTSALFAYDARLLRRLDPAIELGRSFVRAAYQRSYSALDLLWKGIGAVVARHPRYRRFFGALTIPHELPLEARNACLDFLAARAAPADWTRLVHGRVPVEHWPCGPRSAPAPSTPAPSTLVELEARLLEAAVAGVPPLLRHYARFGARNLAFSQDPDFGGSVDALIVVDLDQAPEALRARYFGLQALTA